MWIKAKYTFIKTVHSPRFYGGPYLQAKHADVCSGVLFWTACTRRPHVLSLSSSSGCEKSDSWRQARSVKTAKKVMNGTTMWSCDTELCTNGVEATKCWVFVAHFFNLLDFTVSLSYRDWHSETPWSHSSNQPGGTYCQAQDFLLHTNYTLEMWCANTKSANQVPNSPVKTLVIPMSWSYRYFEWQDASMFLEPTKISWSSDRWLKKVWISAIFFSDVLNHNKMNENNRKTNLWRSNSYI